MKTYISLLRGINVGGHKKIKMADLKALYESLGFKQVQTYIQSGNIVFQFKETDASLIEEMIFNKIKSRYGFDVPNLILTVSEIEKAIKDNPFNQHEKMYFVFLNEIPQQQEVDNLNGLSFDQEYFKLINRVVYFYCPNGYRNAKMNNNFLEKKLNIWATSRNLNTTKKLLEMVKFIK